MDNKNGLQKSIEQMGKEQVSRYLPKGMRIHTCNMHGGFVAHYKNKSPLCPLCIKEAPPTEGNGITATQVELFIDMRDNMQAVQDYISGQ